MTEQDWIERCERQAIRINELERALKSATDSLRVARPDAEMALLRGLSRSAVNCGQGSCCYLVNSVLCDREERAKKTTVGD